MGYRYARAATLAIEPRISDRARIVLGRMAWHVLDNPQGDKPAGEYWAGWEYLAMPWDDGTRTAGTLKNLVGRALVELVRAGYIKPLGAAHLGSRQRYAITLDI